MLDQKFRSLQEGRIPKPSRCFWLPTCWFLGKWSWNPSVEDWLSPVRSEGQAWSYWSSLACSRHQGPQKARGLSHRFDLGKMRTDWTDTGPCRSLHCFTLSYWRFTVYWYCCLSCECSVDTELWMPQYQQNIERQCLQQKQHGSQNLWVVNHDPSVLLLQIFAILEVRHES